MHKPVIILNIISIYKISVTCRTNKSQKRYGYISAYMNENLKNKLEFEIQNKTEVIYKPSYIFFFYFFFSFRVYKCLLYTRSRHGLHATVITKAAWRPSSSSSSRSPKPVLIRCTVVMRLE